MNQLKFKWINLNSNELTMKIDLSNSSEIDLSWPMSNKYAN